MTYPSTQESRTLSQAARPRVPAVVVGAAGLMLVGAVLTAAWIATRAAVQASHPSGGPGPFPGWFGPAYLSLLSVLGCGPWLWMAWKTLTGRGWARYASLVLLGIYWASFIPALIQRPGSMGVVAGVGAELLVGYAAIVLLWLPASSQFFRAAKQARAAASGV